jgi:hypothetical protein
MIYYYLVLKFKNKGNVAPIFVATLDKIIINNIYNKLGTLGKYFSYNFIKTIYKAIQINLLTNIIINTIILRKFDINTSYDR